MEQLGQNFAMNKPTFTFITRSMQTVGVFTGTVKNVFLNDLFYEIKFFW